MTTFTPLRSSLLIGFLGFSLIACDSGTGDGTSGNQLSGSGGDGSGGGASGAGGAGTVALPTDLSLIDDMEDMDGSIIGTDGRVGAWYTYNDETPPPATQMPEAMQPGFAMAAITPPRDTSTYAANTTGSGFTDWGAGIGLGLNTDSTGKQPYDASQYKGIMFFARTGPGGIKNIRLNVQDAQTAPEGGICDKTATKGCNDHRGMAISLTEEWKAFVCPFDKLTQSGFGMAYPAFQTDKLFDIQFQAGKQATFDIWLDDIAFYK